MSESEAKAKPKRKCGFAAMSRERLAEVASKGGKQAHANGEAHTFTPEEARIAGRKGGLAAYRKRIEAARKENP